MHSLYHTLLLKHHENYFIFQTNKLGSPHLYTTSSDKQTDSAGLTTTSSMLKLSQNQEKEILSEKIG